MDREINLLLISEDGVNHYTAIKSLSKLLKSNNTKHKRKQYFCTNCLQGFSLEASRDRHQTYCEDNGTVKVEMPKYPIVEFKDGQNQFRVPFIMYADFESILKPIGLQPQILINLILIELMNMHHPVSVFIVSLLMEKLAIR